jgi:hypothetical protein
MYLAKQSPDEILEMNIFDRKNPVMVTKKKFNYTML